jgi:Na+/proline symporter
MATAVVTDFYGRIAPAGGTDAQRLRLAQWMTVLFGVIGTLAALALATFDILSIYDVYLSLAGLTGGVLAGLFALGIFTRRANGTGALVGAVLGIATLYLVERHTRIHFLLYGPIGIASSALLGFLASLLFGRPLTSLEGLTIYSRGRRPGANLAPAAFGEAGAPA